jgi:hypothetical protein
MGAERGARLLFALTVVWALAESPLWPVLAVLAAAVLGAAALWLACWCIFRDLESVPRENARTAAENRPR